MRFYHEKLIVNLISIKSLAFVAASETNYFGPVSQLS